MLISVLTISILGIGFSTTNLISASEQKVARNAQQTYNIYNYTAYNNIMSTSYYRILDDFIVTDKAVQSTTTETYRKLSDALRYSYIDYTSTGTVMSGKEVLSQAAVLDKDAMLAIKEFIKDRKTSAEIKLTNFLQLDFNNENNKLEFKAKDKVYLLPFTMVANSKSTGCSITSGYEVRGCFVDISISNATVTMRLNVSEAVIKEEYFLCE